MILDEQFGEIDSEAQSINFVFFVMFHPSTNVCGSFQRRNFCCGFFDDLLNRRAERFVIRSWILIKKISADYAPIGRNYVAWRLVLFVVTVGVLCGFYGWQKSLLLRETNQAELYLQLNNYIRAGNCVWIFEESQNKFCCMKKFLFLELLRNHPIWCQPPRSEIKWEKHS